MGKKKNQKNKKDDWSDDDEKEKKLKELLAKKDEESSEEDAIQTTSAFAGLEIEDDKEDEVDEEDGGDGNAKKKNLTAREKKRLKQQEKARKAREAAAAKQDANGSDGPPLGHGEDSESEEGNRSIDIKIENFSISVPGKVLLKNTTVTLAKGIRYGLAGPNGSGKSTLLRHISGRIGDFSKIKKHISILHVEQEVVGDDTEALQSVMESDTELVALLAEKRKLEAMAESDASNERLGVVYQKLADKGADAAVARASKILKGLQFAQEEFTKATREFSGGWRMRLALARALFMQPDVLLLDEPTNHLDLYAVIWLEHYLQSWKNTLLVVSHDRGFLNAVVNQVVYIYDEQLYVYKGDYDTFDRAHKQFITSKRSKAEKDAKKLAMLQRQVAQQKQKAAGSKDTKGGGKDKGAKGKGGQARAAKGQGGGASTKEKLIRQMKEEEVSKLPRDYEVQFDFPDADPLPVPVIQIKGATFGYNDMEQPLFRNVEASVDLDSKIALVGANGSGKSTLMKVLMGKLEPTEGEVVVQRKLRYGYFNQHFVDQISMDDTPVSHIEKMLREKDVEMKTSDIRRFLGRFGLTGKTQVLPMTSLSGGQKSRVVMTELALRYPQILFLDEPTNHLDIESVDALNEALQEFNGGIVLVSHDARLISEVCTEIWILNRENQSVDVWNGTFDDYRQHLIDEHFADMTDSEQEEDEWDQRKGKKKQRAEEQAEQKASKANRARGRQK